MARIVPALIAAGCTLVCGVRADAQRPALLPAVQKISYGTGSVPLCNLRPAASAGVDDGALANLRALLQERCSGRTSADVPLVLSQDRADGALPGADDQGGPQGREAYSISVSLARVELHGTTGAALFYAVQTLRQMAVGASLPVVKVEDWPAMPYRGFMMDMSHGAVPTVAEVERQIDLLARFKANQYFFYVEANLSTLR